MDAQHKVMGSYSSSSACTGESPCRAVVKRQRTKRHGALPPLPSSAASTASSSTSSAEESGFTDEEEDMANCLILLAQGGGGPQKFITRRFTEAATTADGRVGFYVYECKTCNRCFPSFQALGGHRASHKKLKMVTAIPSEEKKAGAADECNLQMSMNSCLNPMASAGTGAATGGKAKVHECSICGKEFSSGQALGGHMRRHRPAIPPDELKKEKNVLSLDLNLPAPADEENPFTITGKSPVFPPTLAAALVGCHY